MISGENLIKIFNIMLEGKELTTKELNGLGLKSKDLKDSIENGILVRVKKGFYSLKTVDDLFYYGKQLIAQKEYDKATQCFEKCFEIDSTHNGACFQLFLRCIEEENYDKAFEYFNIFYDNDNKFYNVDNNFYLYLLNMVTTIPENYRQYAKFLKYPDIRVDKEDKRYYDIAKQNKIRLSALNKKFVLALKQVNEYIEEKGSISIQDMVIKLLLNKVMNVYRQNNNYVLNLIKQKEYQKIVDFYEKMEERYDLSISDEYALILAKELLKLKYSKSIPKVQIYDTDDLFVAIDGKNYELALALTNGRVNKLYLLLQDIVTICKDLRDNKTNKQQDVFEDKMVTQEETKVTNTSSFADITKFLMINDFDNLFKTLKNYLKSIKKSQYEFLIIDLIKVSILEKDKAFVKPLTTLSLISRKNYSFDISSFIQEFYINLSNNNFEVARIYLDIITKGNKLGQECIITDGLYQVLEESEKLVQYKRDNMILSSVNESLEKNNNYEGTDSICQDSDLEVNEEEELETSSLDFDDQSLQSLEEKKKEIEDKEKLFIDLKYKKLVNDKGIILLKSMDDNKIERILGLVNEYPDMVAFVIEDNFKKRIVLRYKPFIEEFVDSKNIISLAEKAYKEGNFDECIEKYSFLLQVFNEPRSFIYFKIGMSYFKKKNKSLALDYLTIASAIAKKENRNVDYSNLFAKLRGGSLTEKEERKPTFVMSQKDFNYHDVNDYYGIENFAQINSYINESGLDVETACNQLGLASETINLIKLIYAREFYTQGNYTKGDLFFKSVEKSKEKTKEVIQIMEEIRKNKRFYKNRQGEDLLQLSLTLIPKEKNVEN